MQLLGKRILCKKIAKEDKTPGGLILSEATIPNEYEVVAIGKKVEHLKVGDKIRTFKYSEGTQAVYEGVECVIFDEEGDVEFMV